jgi:uncharacterized phage-associated protein
MIFNEKKAAQVAAFFAYKAGGNINVLKLMKLMYLAERESFREFGEPMIGDAMVSMPRGPVLSNTYDFTTSGGYDPRGWSFWLKDRAGHSIGLRRKIGNPSEVLLELSNAELQLIGKVWEKFGGKDKWELVRFTHDECKEWQDPNGSSAGIPPERLLEALGYDKQERTFLVEKITQQKAIDQFFIEQ